MAAVAALGACSSGDISDDDIALMTLAELVRLQQADASNDTVLMLIDPRSPTAFASGHIPGATNLRISDLDNRYGLDPDINRHDNLVVYGDDPASPAAKGMTKRLMVHGYKRKKIKMFAGGLGAWARAGKPIDRDDPPKDQ